MKRLSLRLIIPLFTADPKRSKDDVAYHHLPRPPSPNRLGPSFTRAASPSSSEYSCDSDAAPQPRSTVKTLKHARRSSTLSDTGTDRRRLAIVQMETVAEGQPKAVSERGHKPETNFAGLAIVAPPDASPTAYTHLSPPTSATRTRNEPKHVTAISSQPSSSVGPTPAIQPLDIASSTSINLHSPIVDQPITTPPIGHTKDIYAPVAGPVVVSLEPSRPLNIRSKNNSPAPPITAHSLSESPSKRSGISYLQYQPGAILGSRPRFLVKF